MPTLDEKLQKSVDVIRDHITDEGFVLSFSGGKDSSVLKHIIRTSFPGVPLRSMYIRSGLEGDFLIDFLSQFHHDTEFIDPEVDVLEHMRSTGYLPTIKGPYCCHKVFAVGWSKLHNAARYSIQGVRHDDYWHAEENEWGIINEPEHSIVMQDGYHKILYPIFEWTDADVDEYIARHSIPLPPEYGMGERLYTCPLCCSMKIATKKAAVRMYPKLTAKYKTLCEEFWNKDPELQKMYESPDAYWEMYLNSRSTVTKPE
mgnify:CR=1 FL=1